MAGHHLRSRGCWWWAAYLEERSGVAGAARQGEGPMTSSMLRRRALGADEVDPPLPDLPWSTNERLNAMRRATSSTSSGSASRSRLDQSSSEPESPPEAALLRSPAIECFWRGSEVEWTERGVKWSSD